MARFRLGRLTATTLAGSGRPRLSMRRGHHRAGTIGSPTQVTSQRSQTWRAPFRHTMAAMIHRAAGPMRVLIAFLVLLAGASLLAGMVHHSSAEASADPVSIVVVGDFTDSASSDVAAPTATSEGAIVSLAAGCALLALCCAAIMIQGVRASAPSESPNPPTLAMRVARAAAALVSPWPTGPSLHSLSISRT